MEKTATTEFPVPARSFYKPFIVDGYDHNFHILDNAVSALEDTCGEQQQEIDALKADVALKAYTTDVDAKDATTLESAKAYADAKDAVTLTDAKAYTDSREMIIRTDMVAADAVVLSGAKAYADQVVTALVDGAPEALDTLKELASALGNDANFSATVMTEIGKRVLNTDPRLSDARNVIDQKGNGTLKLWTGTQAQYDALAVKDNDTLYFIR